MCEALDYPKAMTIEQKFLWAWDKIKYYFKKIETYDAICNEFSDIKKTLHVIESNSSSSIKVSNAMCLKTMEHDSTLNQVHLRLTEESTRRDLKEDLLYSKLQDFHDDLEEHKVDQKNKIESLKQEFQVKLNEHVTLEDAQNLLRFFKQNLDLLGCQIGKASLSIESMSKEIEELKYHRENLQFGLSELSKENYRLRNALVKKGVTA